MSGERSGALAGVTRLAKGWPACPVARLAARPARISRRASIMASYCSIALLRPACCHNWLAL